jgi:hypothetical protein
LIIKSFFRGTYKDGLHAADSLFTVGLGVTLVLVLVLVLVLAAASAEKALENTAVPYMLRQ